MLLFFVMKLFCTSCNICCMASVEVFYSRSGTKWLPCCLVLLSCTVVNDQRVSSIDNWQNQWLLLNLCFFHTLYWDFIKYCMTPLWSMHRGAMSFIPLFAHSSTVRRNRRFYLHLSCRCHLMANLRQTIAIRRINVRSLQQHKSAVEVHHLLSD
jgi:hypothetical protein